MHERENPAQEIGKCIRLRLWRVEREADNEANRQGQYGNHNDFFIAPAIFFRFGFHVLLLYHTKFLGKKLHLDDFECAVYFGGGCRAAEAKSDACPCALFRMAERLDNV